MMLFPFRAHRRLGFTRAPVLGAGCAVAGEDSTALLTSVYPMVTQYIMRPLSGRLS